MKIHQKKNSDSFLIQISEIKKTEWETFKRRLLASDGKHRLKLYWTREAFYRRFLYQNENPSKRRKNWNSFLIQISEIKKTEWETFKRRHLASDGKHRLKL